MTRPKLVDAGIVRKALELAGEEIREQRFLGEIMLCGGWACLLRYCWVHEGSRANADISFDGRNGLIRQATSWAGRRVGLPNGWVDDILPFLCGDGIASPGGFPAGMYPTWERPGLRVFAAPPRLLVPMVFLATLRPMRDTEIDDLEPAVRIAAGIGIRSGRDLKAVVAPYLKRAEESNEPRDQEIRQRLAYFESMLDRFGYKPAIEVQPRSFADVADLSRRYGKDQRLGWSELIDGFYHEDAAAQQAMLDPAPVPTGDVKFDAEIGATTEHLAQRFGLKVPSWTWDAAFMGEPAPSFWPNWSEARDVYIVESPPAFRRRLIFTQAEPLINAKFPHARKVRMPFWE